MSKKICGTMVVFLALMALSFSTSSFFFFSFKKLFLVNIAHVDMSHFIPLLFDAWMRFSSALRKRKKNKNFKSQC